MRSDFTYGVFLQSVIDFFIVAVVIFLVIRYSFEIQEERGSRGRSQRNRRTRSTSHGNSRFVERAKKPIDVEKDNLLIGCPFLI